MIRFLAVTLVVFFAVSSAEARTKIKSEITNEAGEVIGKRKVIIDKHGNAKRGVDKIQSAENRGAKTKTDFKTGHVKNKQWNNGQTKTDHFTDPSKVGIGQAKAPEPLKIDMSKMPKMKAPEIKVELPNRPKPELEEVRQHKIHQEAKQAKELTQAEKTKVYNLVASKLSPAQQKAFAVKDCAGVPFKLSDIVPDAAVRDSLTGYPGFDPGYKGNVNRPICKTIKSAAK